MYEDQNTIREPINQSDFSNRRYNQNTFRVYDFLVDCVLRTSLPFEISRTTGIYFETGCSRCRRSNKRMLLTLFSLCTPFAMRAQTHEWILSRFPLSTIIHKLLHKRSLSFE